MNTIGLLLAMGLAFGPPEDLKVDRAFLDKKTIDALKSFDSVGHRWIEEADRARVERLVKAFQTKATGVSGSGAMFLYEQGPDAEFAQFDSKPFNVSLLGRAAGSKYLAEHSEEVSLYLAEANKALIHGTSKSPTLALSSRGDAIFARRANEVMAITENVGVPKLATDTDLNASELMRFLQVTQRINEADYYKRSLVSGAVLDQLSQIKDFVVDIERRVVDVNGTPRFKHIGTGFLLRGHVITCAHVLSMDCWDDDAKQVSYSQLRVVLADDQGRFDASDQSAIEVNSDASELICAWDLASLRLRKPQNPDLAGRAQRILAKYGKAGSPVGFDTGQIDLSANIVYGLGASEIRGKAGVQVVWIQPGPVLFPPRAFPRDQDDQPDDAFSRAFRNQVFGLMARKNWAGVAQPSADFVQVLRDAWQSLTSGSGTLPRYGRCAEGCRLIYPAGTEGRLTTLCNDPAFRKDPMVECIGTDIVTVDGTSGAPIFVLGDGIQVVVGIHSGSYRTETSRLLPPSLQEMSRETPFGRAWQQALKSIIERDGDSPW